jgi:hypothetical protein
MEEVDDESIAKPRESLMYASSHVAHTNATHAAKAREENGKNIVLNRHV